MEPDIRLIAVDMDGSLLDDAKRIHDDFWPLLDELDRRGILLCPASGRQYATLRRQLGRDELVYIAENGAYVVQHDQEISVDPLDLGTARKVIETVRAASRARPGHGAVRQAVGLRGADRRPVPRPGAPVLRAAGDGRRT